MSTFKPLKTLTSRRQVLKAGLAALTLSGMSQAIAKDEPLKTSNGHSKPKAKKSGGKRVVVLDPGHGGIDTGAIGRNGSKEKHVVLAIAKNVRSILRNHGIDARLTRSGDTFIPLYDRVEIAHKHGADLFMSIHADGFTNPKAAGASVFALSNRGASSAMAKYLSERENRADEVAGKKATDKDHLLQQVLFDLVQTDTIKNSLTLGSHILKKIKPVHKLHSRNTEQAAFVVLKSPSVPSVLVETSFITNPEEERLLGTAAGDKQTALHIARTPACRSVNENLLNVGQRGEGDFTQHAFVSGDITPAHNRQGFALQLFFNDAACGSGEFRIFIQEEHPDSVVFC